MSKYISIDNQGHVKAHDYLGQMSATAQTIELSDNIRKNDAIAKKHGTFYYSVDGLICFSGDVYSEYRNEIFKNFKEMTQKCVSLSQLEYVIDMEQIDVESRRYVRDFMTTYELNEHEIALLCSSVKDAIVWSKKNKPIQHETTIYSY